MQLVDGGKHLADVESRVLFFQHARIVEQSAEVATGHVFHREVDMLRVLEGVKKANEPGRFRGCQDVAFDEDMTNLGKMRNM